MSKNNEIKNIYKQRNQFILIGLTGRTGSGCSTVAEILSRDSMDKLDLKSYKTCDFNNAEERKYSVIYRYMKEGKKWKKFLIIEASAIIFSYILQDTYGKLFDFIDSVNEKGQIQGVEDIKRKIVENFSGNSINNDVDIKAKYGDKIIDENIHKIIDSQLNESALNQMVKGQKINELNNIVKCLTSEAQKKKNDFRNAVRNTCIEIFEKEDEEKREEKDEEKSRETKLYNLYTYLMQLAGNNLRSSGKYYDNSEQDERLFTVAERIDLLIMAVRYTDFLKEKEECKTRICIDALRNSEEIQYFRDKYRAFYAVAVNTENEHRQNRLGLNKKELAGLDEIEYPDKNAIFYKQNIQACLEISDIYLYNPNVFEHKYFELCEQILKYIALMLQPGLIAPTHLERCMQLAFNAKYNSGCLSRQVGAVVTGEDFSVRSVGWNDVPKGHIPCNLRCVEDYCRNKDDETFSEYELNDALFDETMSKINISLQKSSVNKNGKYYSYCFKDIYNGLKNQKNQVYTRALHAEENAFLQIAKYGGAKIEGGKLFTTASPCELCSKKAYQLGIKEIYYIDPYPGISKTHILTFGKSNNPEMILFKGAIGNAYISLYSPRMAYKDELELVTGICAKNEAEQVYKKHKDDLK